MNNIYDILDERFEKVAMLNEELEKEAAKKINLGPIADVFTGNNISKANKELAKAERLSNVPGFGSAIADSVQNADRILSDRRLYEASQGLSKELGKTKKGLETSSKESGIKALKENIMRRKEFGTNKEKQRIIDEINNSVSQGKRIDYDKLTTKPSIIGNKVVDPGISKDQIKAYNKSVGNANAVDKIQGDASNIDEVVTRTQGRFNKLKDKLSGVKSIDDAKALGKNTLKDIKAQGAGRNVREANRTIADAKAVAAPFAEPVNASLQGNVNKAKANVNKEIAKTVGAYGAVGAGVGMGAKAVANANSPKQENSQKPFYPEYKNNINKLAEEIISELSK